MHDEQREFVRFALEVGALKLGRFTLKSGRESPYFFNAGAFSSGQRLLELARCYAAAIRRSGLEFDVLFGAAYKGIPLATAVAIALAETGRDVPWCCNRKEAKDHGELGTFIGHPPEGRVLMVDDVLSAGTSARASMELLEAGGATVAGLLVALDREERGRGPLAAADELRGEHGLVVVALVSLREVLEFLKLDPARADDVTRVEHYLARYGGAGAQ